MSINLNLKATVQSTLHKTTGDEKRLIKEEFDLYQTPTKVTEKILNSKSPMLAYLNWLKEIEPEDTITYAVIQEGIFGEDYYSKEEYEEKTDDTRIPWDILPKVEQPSNRVKHERELNQWLKEHEGWTIEWYSM
jgi:hypothetical protein